MKTKAINAPLSGDSTQQTGNRTIRFGIWTGVGLFFLIFFTLLKLPEDRIKGYINGMLSAQLAQKGMRFTAQETHLSYLFGITYSLKGVTFSFPPPAPPAHIDEIDVSPSILALLSGKQAGDLHIYHKGGDIQVSFSIGNTKADLGVKAKSFDLGKTGLLPVLTDVQASAILDGKANLSGDLNIPSTLEGVLKFTFRKLFIDTQNIQGFRIPQLNISEGDVDITIEKAKATIKTLRLGKAGAAPAPAPTGTSQASGSSSTASGATASATPVDDLQASVTGDVGLAKTWGQSQLNLKLRFSLSESLKKAFLLIDALLGSYKQDDGSYAMGLTGTVEAPIPSSGK